MIRHTQRHLASLRRRDGHTIDGLPGDCLRACVASIFEYSDDRAVPHFAMASTGSWWDALRLWSIEQLGLDWAVAWSDPDYESPAVVGKTSPGRVIPPDWATYHADRYSGGLTIVGGHSPRGAFLHAVVGTPTGDVVWDPHPSRAGLVSVTDVKIPVAPLVLVGYPPRRLALPAGAAA